MASVSVEALMLQNSPTSRLFNCRRRTTCTQRNTSMLSIFGIRPTRSAMSMKSPAGMTSPASVRRPRQRLVEAHLALRQRDDRLQIKIDAVVVGGLGDQFADGLAAHALKTPGAGHGIGLAERQRLVGRRRRGRRGRLRHRPVRHRALLPQSRFMRGNGFGDLARPARSVRRSRKPADRPRRARG